MEAMGPMGANPLSRQNTSNQDEIMYTDSDPGDAVMEQETVPPKVTKGSIVYWSKLMHVTGTKPVTVEQHIVDEEVNR